MAHLTDEFVKAGLSFSRWRHGGWYVHGIRHPNGGCGCVSKNYDDGKWRIVGDPRGFTNAPTFASRVEAAMAELELVRQMKTGAATRQASAKD